MEHAAEPVDVGRGADLPPIGEDLLGGHEGRRPDELVGPCEPGRPGLAREPEVHELGRAALVEEDVRGLEVAVDDPLRVHEGESLSEVADDARRLDRVEQSLALDARLERAARREVHDEVEPAVGGPERVDADDVRVSVHLRERLALALQALDEARVRALGESLDRVARLRLHVLGEEDDAHAARAQAVEEPEVPDPEPLAPDEDVARAEGLPHARAPREGVASLPRSRRHLDDPGEALHGLLLGEDAAVDERARERRSARAARLARLVEVGAQGRGVELPERVEEPGEMGVESELVYEHRGKLSLGLCRLARLREAGPSSRR